MFANVVRGFALCLLLALPVVPQVDQSSVNGTITDPSASIAPNATMDISSSETGFHRQATTTDTGTFRLTGLPGSILVCPEAMDRG